MPVDLDKLKRILLVGNPNVGKSVVFSRLTGVKVISSNYPGTTVGFTRGFLKLDGKAVEVVDVPGTYSLEPTSPAEEVAVRMIREADPAETVIVNVLDATNLERNLKLTLDLLELGIPTVLALNIWDETRHRGIRIGIPELEKELGVPVVPTVAPSGEGFRELKKRLREAAVPGLPADCVSSAADAKWACIGRLTAKVQTVSHRHHTLTDRFEEWSVRPVLGLLIAGVIIYASFRLIRLVGEGLINSVFDPLFLGPYARLLSGLSDSLGGGGIFHQILIGKLIGGEIDFLQSFGLLTTALYIELAVVLPYVFAFYLVLGFLEDVGYLPRLATVVDTLMHRLGIHGYAIIPVMLGFGCNVPGIMATRILESRRERFITSAIISIGVPCAALQAMVLGLVGGRGGQYVLLVYLTLFLVWIALGLVLNLLIKGFSPELLIEIPPYRFPSLRIVVEKLRLRIWGFLVEALPVVLLGVLAVNLLYSLGIFDFLVSLTAPVIQGILGLPREAVVSILIGFLRKDVAVGLLSPLGLSAKQLVIACTTLAMFFPCIATFVVLIRELGWKDMLKITFLMMVLAILVGGLQNLVL